MTEKSTISRTPAPITKKSLIEDLSNLGLKTGQTILVHSSMSQIGWVSGGAQTVIEALLSILGNEGTLMMPTHSAQNTNPANWQHPPVPESWWQTLRENRPAYDPAITPTREMGAIPEMFRNYPNVKRSAHPVGSFSAIGHHTDYLLDNHTDLKEMFGDNSPIGKLYELDGHVLLLGVGHANNTSIHLAEYRAGFPTKKYIQEGCAMMVDGQRQWVDFEMFDVDDEDFVDIGDAYHSKHGKVSGKVGIADTILVSQRSIVDFAISWMEANRG